MTRLATVLAVAASALDVYAFVAADQRWPGKQEPPGLVLFALVLLGLNAIVTVAGTIAAGIEGKLTARVALRIAWGGVIYPCIAAIKLGRWIAHGDGHA